MYVIKYKETNEIIICKDRKLDFEINKTASLSFTLYQNSKFYDVLEEYVSLITVYDDEEKMFDGQVILITNEMDDNGIFCKKVECLDKLTYLSRVRTGRYDIHPGEYTPTSSDAADLQLLTNMTVKRYIDQMLMNYEIRKEDEAERSFVQGNIDVEDRLTRQTNRESILEELQDLAEEHNAIFYVTYDSNELAYLNFRNADKYMPEGPTLAKAVNIKSFSIKNNLGCKISRLYAYGKDGLSISDANPTYENYIVDKEIESKYGVNEYVEIWEDVTDVNNLYKKAVQFLKNYNNDDYSIECKAVDLGYLESNKTIKNKFKKLRINQVCHIWIEDLNVYKDYRLTKLSLDLDEPWNSDLGFGKQITSFINQNINFVKKTNRKIVLLNNNKEV